MSDNILVTRSSMPSLDEYIEEISIFGHWMKHEMQMLLMKKHSCSCVPTR